MFVTAKYRRTRERLLAAGIATESDFMAPEPATDEELARAHGRAYLDKIREGGFSLAELWRLEVPFTAEVREAMVLACGGTLLACRTALELGTSAHLGGGFHHAFRDHGEGFCLLNDTAVALGTLLAEHAIERAAVVDLDVHHGNGTAAIFAGDDGVFTFSMHQERNYPAHKPPSTLDIGLDDGTDDAAYLEVLRGALPRVFDDFSPQLAIYLAGADPYRQDQLGGLALTRDGLRERDRTVLRAARASGVPVAVTLAGGYAVRLDDTVSIHTATIEELVAIRSEWEEPS